MYCINLLKRQKNYKTVFYCKIKKEYIDYRIDCENCSKKNLIRNKPIKKVSKKRIFVTDEIYNEVYKRDKGKCRLCGNYKNLHLHHILGRGKDLTNNIDNCILLCNYCHLEVVHKNQKKYRPLLLKIVENSKNI